MNQRILYLPGLDGEPNVPERLQPHLPDAELVAFTYPEDADLSWPQMAQAVTDKLASLKTDLLIGESFGGAVAMKTTLLHREKIRGMCLVASFSMNPEPFAAAIGRTATRVLPQCMMKPVARLLANWKLAGTLEGAEREKFLKRFTDLDYRVISARLKLLQSYDVEDRMVGIRCPVDIVFGSADPIAGSSRQQEIWQRIPDLRMRQLDGYGHLISHEVPVGVAARIQSWLARLENAVGK